MINLKQTISLLLVALLMSSCGIYNFTGAGAINAKTFQVKTFQNISELVEPGIERNFTLKLQDLIQNQTNLNLTNSNADLTYEGEIIDYRISPMTTTADLKAAQNRVSITVNLRFSNKNKAEDNFEKNFSFYYDYPADEQLNGSRLKTALDEIFSRITQDIFTETLAKW
ncbi:LPS assembly lipoprotein LptE [Flavobacterium sp.]|uniref:LPS assembly lipoprotein LptE n=1 Tax=Flavobacterium sp. TaxID=239 RepID=UPI003D0C46CC